MRIPFIGGTTKASSLVVSADRSVNCYVVPAPGATRPMFMEGTPGTVEFADLSSGEVRGLWEMGAYMYAVRGNTFYQIDSGGNETSNGTLSTSIGQVRWSDNGTQIKVVDGSGGYIYDTSTGVFGAIGDADFLGASHVGFIDGYFVYAGNTDGKFYITALYDGTSVDALDFATAESDPDDTVALIVDHEEVWLFGSDSAEPWRNTGASDFPFQKVGGATVDAGIIARYSLASLDNSMYWLGRTREGFKGVLRMENYTPVSVTSDAVWREMDGYETKSDAIAFTLVHGRRHWYVITFPTEGKTWVYDASIQDPALAWFEWSTFGKGRFRANCHVYFNGKHYVGDYQNGKIYRLDWDAYTDGGVTIRRERTRSISSGDGRAMFLREFEAVMESGVGTVTGQGQNPSLMLQISRDGGRTYGAELWRNIGPLGNYRKRARWQALGRGYELALTLAYTDPAQFKLIDAYARIDLGEH